MARNFHSSVAFEHASAGGRIAGRSTATLVLISLRPEQWSKNLLVFAGVLFARRLTDLRAVAVTVAAFVIFCMLSAAVYLFNDVVDREGDRSHPLKRSRPVASGALSPTTALVAAALLSAGALGASIALRPAFGAVAAAFLALLLLYSVALKYVVLVDVLAISAGFVLRAVGGAVVIPVPISNWLLVCTTLLALFLGLSKRRHELTLLADGAPGHRRILNEYSPYLLDQMVAVVTASALMAYASYATSQDTAERLGTNHLIVTFPFVLYGIFRYLYLVHLKSGGGSPSTLLLTDRPLLVCVALWVATVVALLYSPLRH